MGIRYISLQESAESLGFSTIEEALDAGYEVAYTADPTNAHLIKRGSNNEQQTQSNHA